MGRAKSQINQSIKLRGFPDETDLDLYSKINAQNSYSDLKEIIDQEVLNQDLKHLTSINEYLLNPSIGKTSSKFVVKEETKQLLALAVSSGQIVAGIPWKKIGLTYLEDCTIIARSNNEWDTVSERRNILEAVREIKNQNDESDDDSFSALKRLIRGHGGQEFDCEPIRKIAGCFAYQSSYPITTGRQAQIAVLQGYIYALAAQLLGEYDLDEEVIKFNNRVNAAFQESILNSIGYR